MQPNSKPLTLAMTLSMPESSYIKSIPSHQTTKSSQNPNLIGVEANNILTTCKSKHPNRHTHGCHLTTQPFPRPINYIHPLLFQNQCTTYQHMRKNQKENPLFFLVIIDPKHPKKPKSWFTPMHSQNMIRRKRKERNQEQRRIVTNLPDHLLWNTNCGFSLNLKALSNNNPRQELTRYNLTNYPPSHTLKNS